MKLKLFTLFLFVLGVFLFMPFQLCADEKAVEKAASPEMSDEMKAMMAEWAKYAAPGEHHKHLAMAEGTWNTLTRWWMAPGTQPTESKGTCIFRMVLGGRFLHQQCTTEAVGAPQPFEGVGTTGYDIYQQKYVSVWADNMGTMIVSATGSCDGTGKLTTMTGEFPDPVTKKTKKFKYLIRVENDKKSTFEWYVVNPDGAEFKEMEILYTR